MKFFHLGDLHFGKSLHDIPMANEDQPYWIERFFEKVEEHRPDAVVISGDIYDRRDPAPEVMALYDRFITGLSRRNVKVIVIPGNHDSDLRVAYAGQLLESSGVYSVGRLTKQLPHVELAAGGQKVNFWMMPYVYPKLIADVLERPELKSYTEAVRALLKAQDIDTSAINVLAAHQNVLSGGKKPEHSRSESIIGGVGDVDSSVFEDFDYVALGHIHNAQPVGTETVRYAGCPMYYDFSELGRRKDLTLVTVEGKGSIRVESVPIPLLHRLERVMGTVDELVSMAEDYPDKSGIYFQALVTEKVMPPRTRDRLNAAYGSALVNIAACRPEDEAAFGEDPDLSGIGREDPIDRQFRDFYSEWAGDDLDELQESLLLNVIALQEKSAGCFRTDSRDIPADETEELIAFLMDELKEEEK